MIIKETKDTVMKRNLITKSEKSEPALAKVGLEGRSGFLLFYNDIWICIQRYQKDKLTHYVLLLLI